MSSHYYDYEIPQEILRLIIKNVRNDRSSLKNIALVSQRCAPEAQSLLFHRVAFGCLHWDLVKFGYKSYAPEYTNVAEAENEEKFRWVGRREDLPNFLSTLSPSRPTASYIQELSCQPNSRRDIWISFYGALRQMVNLKCLRIGVAQFVKTLNVQDFLSDHPFQLETFCWVDLRLKVVDPQADIDAYASFISSQPHLKYLHLARPILQRKNLTLNPPTIMISCPALNTMIGDPDTVHLLLPSFANVQSLAYVSGWETLHVNGPLDSVSMSFSHLRVLTFYSMDLENTMLQKMARCLRSLETLHIVNNGMAFDQPLFYRNSRQSSEILPRVREFLSLRVFIWSSYQAIERSQHGFQVAEKDQQSFTKIWFHNLPRFETAYFSAEADRNRYMRWMAGETRPTEVSCDDFQGLVPFHKITLDRRLTYDVGP